MRVYHYTNKKGADSIMASKVIRQSTDEVKDCLLGKGVYLTSLSPGTYSKEQIAQNNYGHPAKASQGYVDYAIQIDIPNHELKPNPDGRDIYCYPGRDLWIENYPYALVTVPDKNESWCTMS